MHADDLKPLKVADLRRILAAAHSPPPARATKADLVARILDSKDAQDAYFSLYPPQQQQPSPDPPAPQPQPVLQPPPSQPPPQQQPPSDAPLSPEELELEKRKARAARFGIPLVNPASDGSDKLKARAQRFGTNAAPAAAAVDPEELEKRKKRAERFGTQPSAST